MRRDADDIKYLQDMIRHAEYAVEFVQGRTLDDMKTDVKLRLAVERALEIIGEAARHVTIGSESRFPDIPWQKIVAHRHVLAHEYGAGWGGRRTSLARGHQPPAALD